MIKYIFCTLLLFSVANAEDPTLIDYGIIPVSDPTFDKNVYNCSKNIEIDYQIISALSSVNAAGLIDNFSNEYYELTVEDFDKVANNNSNASIEKRCTPTGATLTSKVWQTAKSGTWWSPWYPISCCYYCDLGPLSCLSSLGYSFSYSWSFDAGLSFENVAASTGLSLTKSYTKETSFSCEWTGGSGPAQIWYQQQVYWADMQYRIKTYGTNGCVTEGAWSAYKHADVPIKDSIHVGCSVGQNNVNCNASQKNCIRS